MTRSVLTRLCAGTLMTMTLLACGRTTQSAASELQRVHAGSLDVVMLSTGDGLQRGRSSSLLEFRNADGSLADVGPVRVNVTMPMPGMGPMLANTEVRAADVKGRYIVESDFTMAGTWRFTVAWDGPAGRGTVSFPGAVR